jgi:hypothetical protein
MYNNEKDRFIRRNKAYIGAVMIRAMLEFAVFKKKTPSLSWLL